MNKLTHKLIKKLRQRRLAEQEMEKHQKKVMRELLASLTQQAKSQGSR